MATRPTQTRRQRNTGCTCRPRRRSCRRCTICELDSENFRTARRVESNTPTTANTRHVHVTLRLHVQLHNGT
eukprot:5694721-Prymnesium_polylepis.1